MIRFSEKPQHAFLGLSPAKGLLKKIQNFYAGPKPPVNLKMQPWYKMHLTLLFWPKVTPEDLFRLKQGFSHALRNNVPSVSSSIQGFHFFLRPQVLYLRETSQEVIDLQNSMAEIAARLFPDFLPQKNSDTFTPHWTIARKFHTAMLGEKPEFFRELDQFKNEGKVPGLSLYYSYGGRYEPQSISRVVSE